MPLFCAFSRFLLSFPSPTDHTTMYGVPTQTRSPSHSVGFPKPKRAHNTQKNRASQSTSQPSPKSPPTPPPNLTHDNDPPWSSFWCWIFHRHLVQHCRPGHQRGWWSGHVTRYVGQERRNERMWLSIPGVDSSMYGWMDGRIDHQRPKPSENAVIHQG